MKLCYVISELRHMILNGYILEVIEFCRIFIPSAFVQCPLHYAIVNLLIQQVHCALVMW